MNATRTRLLRLIVPLALGAVTFPAQSAIVSHSTWARPVAPPSYVDAGTFLSGQSAYVWNEQQSVQVFNQAVDMLPGSTSSYQPIAGTITGVVDSHMIHHSINWYTSSSMTGSVTFDNPIVGVIFSWQNLNTTDSLFGPAGTTYHVNFLRQLSQAEGFCTINNATLSFNFALAAGFYDYAHVRVLTAPVPAPAAAAPLVVCLLGLRFRRRERA